MNGLIILGIVGVAVWVYNTIQESNRKERIRQEELKRRKNAEDRQRREAEEKQAILFREQERVRKEQLAKRLTEERLQKEAEERERLESERKRLAQIQESARIEKEAYEKQRRAEIDKKEAEKRLAEQKRQERISKLNSLLSKKHNWEQFREVLKKHDIQTLYHFTSRQNITSIKENGGLYSWWYSENNAINIKEAGGGSLSRDLDRHYGLQDFVRLSFTMNHPMMYVARNEGRISDPVVLKINTEVVFLENTKFADMNATKSGHRCGSSISDLENIKFNVVKQPNHFDLSVEEKPYYQAEVLVKTWIPITYITNIYQF